jgi:hypothetical protein
VKFYGAKRGTVVGGFDELGRVRIRIPGFHDEADDDSLPWAEVAIPGLGQGQGRPPSPKEGATAVLLFEDGDPEKPLIVGTFPTRLDTIGSSKTEYVPGDAKRFVDGKVRDTSAGDHITTAGGNIRHITDKGTAELRGRRVVLDAAEGSIVKLATREEIEIFGRSDMSIGGPAEWLFGADFSLATGGGKMSISAALGLEILTSLGGVEVLSYLDDIRLKGVGGEVSMEVTDPTGFIDYANVTVTPFGGVEIFTLIPLNFIQIGRTSLTALFPVCTQNHLHVSPIGLPTSPAIPNPVALPPVLGPGGAFGISNVVLIE